MRKVRISSGDDLHLTRRRAPWARWTRSDAAGSGYFAATRYGLCTAASCAVRGSLEAPADTSLSFVPRCFQPRGSVRWRFRWQKTGQTLSCVVVLRSTHPIHRIFFRIKLVFTGTAIFPIGAPWVQFFGVGGEIYDSKPPLSHPNSLHTHLDACACAQDPTNSRKEKINRERLLQ